MTNNIIIKNRNTFWQQLNSNFDFNFKMPSFNNKSVPLKKIPSKFKESKNIFECIGQVQFNPPTVRKNIKRTNQQTFVLPPKELNKLLNLNRTSRTHLMNLDEALILFKAGKLFNLPPLLFLSPDMQTPLDYACEKTHQPIPNKNTDHDSLKKLIVLCSKRTHGNLTGTAKEINVPRTAISKYLLTTKVDFSLAAFAKIFHPCYLWIWLYGHNDVEFIDAIASFYTIELGIGKEK